MKIQEVVTSVTQSGQPPTQPPPGGPKLLTPQQQTDKIQAAVEAEAAARKQVTDAQEALSAAQEALRDAQTNLSDARKPVSESQLNEYAEDLVDKLTTLLRPLIGRANKQGRPSKMTYLAINQLLNPSGGVNIDEQSLVKLINDHSNLSNLIHKVGKHGVVLATEVKFKSKAKPKKTTPKTKNKKSGVRAAASRGRKYREKALNSP